MNPPLEASRCDGRIVRSLPSARRAHALRALLLAEQLERTAELVRQATRLAVLTANPSDDPTGLHRAMSAVHLYGAQKAIEAIEDALVRLADGSYGTCQACDRTIPLEQLQEIREALICIGCSGPANSIAETRGKSRLGSGRGEHTGATLRPGVLAAGQP